MKEFLRKHDPEKKLSFKDFVTIILMDNKPMPHWLEEMVDERQEMESAVNEAQQIIDGEVG